MAGILFVTWDGGGNLPPALGIAAELAGRGEQVRFLGHEQQRAAIEGAGLRFEAYRHARPWSPAAPARGIRGAVSIFSVFADRGAGEDLLASVRRESADLVVVDCLLLGALAAADRAGLRRAVLAHTFYGYLAQRWSHGPPGLFCRLHGQRSVGLWSAADVLLVTTLAGLDPAAAGGRAAPANACYTGPVVRVTAAPPAPPANQPPRILVSLSTMFFPGQERALQSILDALAGLPVRAVVTTGRAVDPGRLRAAGNCEVHRYLPHDDVLPSVSLVIGHGGHATTMRALAWNRPLLVIPMHPMLDQPMIGKAVSEHGAGEVLPKNASPERIAEAVARLLDSGPHREAAARLGAAIRAQDGAAVAADRLTGLVSLAR